MQMFFFSSPVARVPQAHNLKVVGSNPTPATNQSGWRRGAYDTPVKIPIGFFVAPECSRNAMK
jgi:hypothetical protein